MNNQFSFLAALLLGLAAASAQTATPAPKPPAKNVHFVLEFSAPKKTDNVETPKSPQPVKVYPLSMDVSNGDGIRLFKTKFSDGVEETAYILPGSRLIQRPDLDEIRVLDRLERSSLEYDAPLNTYPGFDWITAGYFRGEATFGERACYKFFRELPPLVSPEGQPGDPVVRSVQGLVKEAYIDKATLLPFAYVDGDMVVSYRFVGTSVPLSLPDEFRKAIRRQAGYRTE